MHKVILVAALVFTAAFFSCTLGQTTTTYTLDAALLMNETNLTCWGSDYLHYSSDLKQLFVGVRCLRSNGSSGHVGQLWAYDFDPIGSLLPTLRQVLTVPTNLIDTTHAIASDGLTSRGNLLATYSNDGLLSTGGGAVFLWHFDGSMWNFVRRASDPRLLSQQFGESMAISPDGTVLVAGGQAPQINSYNNIGISYAFDATFPTSLMANLTSPKDQLLTISEALKDNMYLGSSAVFISNTVFLQGSGNSEFREYTLNPTSSFWNQSFIVQLSSIRFGYRLAYSGQTRTVATGTAYNLNPSSGGEVFILKYDPLNLSVKYSVSQRFQGSGSYFNDDFGHGIVFHGNYAFFNGFSSLTEPPINTTGRSYGDIYFFNTTIQQWTILAIIFPTLGVRFPLTFSFKFDWRLSDLYQLSSLFGNPLAVGNLYLNMSKSWGSYVDAYWNHLGCGVLAIGTRTARGMFLLTKVTHPALFSLQICEVPTFPPPTPTPTPMPTPIPTPILTPQPSPSFTCPPEVPIAQGNLFTCVDGVWTTSNLILNSSTSFISNTIAVLGNLTVSQGSDVVISNSVLNVSGGVNVQADSTLNLSGLSSSVIQGDLVVEAGASLQINVSSGSNPLRVLGCVDLRDSTNLTVHVSRPSLNSTGLQSLPLFRSSYCGASKPNIKIEISDSQNPCERVKDPVMAYSTSGVALVAFQLEPTCTTSAPFTRIPFVSHFLMCASLSFVSS